jgi:hypothetical protein
MKKNKWLQVVMSLILTFGLAALVSAASKTPVYPDGTLLMTNESYAVYVIEKGKKSLIPDPPTFEAKKFRWDQIMKVEPAVLKSIPTGPPIPSVLKKGKK